MALFIYAAALTTAHLLGNAIEILNRPNSAHAALQNGLHPSSLRRNNNTTARKITFRFIADWEISPV